MKPQDLTFRNPLTANQIDACLVELAADWPAAARPRVLDVGCGNGEALARLREMRASERAGDCVVLGVDPDGEALARAARRHAKLARVHPGRAFETARWLEQDWRADAQTSGPWDAAICLGSRHAFGGEPDSRESMLITLRERIVPHGRLLLADGTWRRAPAVEYLAATGMTAEELASLETWHALFDAHGLRLRCEERTSPEDFETYERMFWAQGGEHWQNWSQAFLQWGRQTMGFAAWVLERTD